MSNSNNSLPGDIVSSDLNTFPGVQDPVLVEKARKAAERVEAERAKQADKSRKAAQAILKDMEQEKAATAKKQPAPKKEAGSSGVGADARRRELKVRKCKLYFAKLGDKLSTREPKAYPKTEEGIDELLAEIEADLHSAGGIQQAGLFYVNGCVAVEQASHVFNPLGWELSGPVTSLGATVASNRAQWEDLVTEFAISNAEYFMVGPGKRLIAMTVQMILAVDAANKGARSRSAPPPASDDLMKEAEDL